MSQCLKMGNKGNMNKLLCFITQPTQLCLIFIIICIFILVNCRWVLKTLIPDMYSELEVTVNSADDLTLANMTTLRIFLAISALRIVRFLVFRHCFRVLKFLKRVAPWNRLLVAFLGVLLMTVFVLAPGYQAVFFIARQYADRINSRDVQLSFPGYTNSLIEHKCYLHDSSIEDDCEKDTWQNPFFKYYDDPLVFLQVNPCWPSRLTYTGDHVLRPRLLRQHYRFLSEDIQLPCEFMVQLSENIEDVYIIVKWTMNGTDLELDRRVSVRSSRDFVSRTPLKNEKFGTRWMLVNETLLIRRLRVDDFGIYKCLAFTSFERPSLLSSWLVKEKFQHFSYLVSEHTLFRGLEKTEEVAMHPADAATVLIIFRMLSDSEDEVHVEHRINGVPRHELPEDKCSSELHWPFLDFSKQQRNRKSKCFDFEGNTMLCSFHKFCVEQYHYGLHTFIVRRQFYNPDTASQDYIEHSFGTVMVIPKLSELFSDVKNDAYFNYLHNKECWKNNFTVISEYCTEKLKLMKATSRFIFLLDCWRTMVMYVSLHLYYIWWAWSIVRYVLALTLPDLFKQSVAKNIGSSLSTEVRMSDTGKLYDVFLAHAVSDHLVLQRIQSILQPYELTVYDCQGDVQLGKPTLTAWDHAMEDSISFVVVVSAEYLSDPELALQFQNIYNLVLEDRVRDSHVVLLVTNKCSIPAALEHLPAIDLNQKHWEQQLEWWAFCLKGEFPSKSLLRQMDQDLRRDYQELITPDIGDNKVLRVFPELPVVVRKLDFLFAWAASGCADRKRSSARLPTSEDNVSIHKARSSHSSTQLFDSLESDYESDPECRITDALEPLQDSNGQQCSSGSIYTDHEYLGDELYQSASGCKRMSDKIVYDVFLTYCEESPTDRAIAAELKAVLEGKNSKYKLFPEGQCLSVYDAVQDLMAGHAEVHVVSAAAKSAAYVVLLSPAFCRDPITRRLHFPQVLQAIYSNAVDLECVLIVYTSGVLSQSPSPQRSSYNQSGDEGEGGDEENLSDSSSCNNELTDREEEAKNTETFALPKWFKAFTQIHWSPCLGLYEEDRLRRWARYVHSLKIRAHASDRK